MKARNALSLNKQRLLPRVAVAIAVWVSAFFLLIQVMSGFHSHDDLDHRLAEDGDLTAECSFCFVAAQSVFDIPPAPYYLGTSEKPSFSSEALHTEQRLVQASVYDGPRAPPFLQN